MVHPVRRTAHQPSLAATVRPPLDAPGQPGKLTGHANAVSVVARAVADRARREDVAEAASNQNASGAADSDDGRRVVARHGDPGALARAHRDIRPRE